MNAVTRGVRNAFRNSIRTFSIVVILGLSVGLALTMLVARKAVDNKIGSVKASIGNTITISPAGARGFEGGGEPLTLDQLKKVKTISSVTKVTAMLSDRLTASTTSLASAVEAGTLGRRQAGISGAQPTPLSGDGEADGAQPAAHSFTPPVIASGVNDLSRLSVYGGDSVTYTSGSAFNPASDKDEAVVGKALAEKNGLFVGSAFTVYGTNIKVVGIYDTGTAFANAGLLMPLATLQRLSGRTGEATGAVVTIDSLDNMPSALNAIKTTLGGAVDVTNNQENATSVTGPLENVRSIATISLIGSLIAGAAVILLTMMMIVRERRREIGVMKAIGSSNAKTMLQFASEAVTLTVLGLIVGLGLGILGSAPVTQTLVNSSVASTSQAPGRGGHVPGRGLRAFGADGVASLRNIQANVGWEIIGYGVLAAVAIALVGSALPAYFISKIRPSEVMRAE